MPTATTVPAASAQAADLCVSGHNLTTLRRTSTIIHNLCGGNLKCRIVITEFILFPCVASAELVYRCRFRTRIPGSPDLLLRGDHGSCDLDHSGHTLSLRSESTGDPPSGRPANGKADYTGVVAFGGRVDSNPGGQGRLLDEFNQFLPFGLTLSLLPPTVTVRNRYRKRRLAGKPRKNAI